MIASRAGSRAWCSLPATPRSRSQVTLQARARCVCVAPRMLGWVAKSTRPATRPTMGTPCSVRFASRCSIEPSSSAQSTAKAPLASSLVQVPPLICGMSGTMSRWRIASRRGYWSRMSACLRLLERAPVQAAPSGRSHGDVGSGKAASAVSPNFSKRANSRLRPSRILPASSGSKSQK